MRILLTGELNTSYYINDNMVQRGEDGTFQRTRKPWSLDNFDDGYVDNRGRFRVWLPDHPRAYEGGYILRSIVAYEAYHGIPVPIYMDVHHIDEDKTNDSRDNLVMMIHSQHTKLTMNQKRPLQVEVRTCETCGKEFVIPKYKLKDLSSGSKKRGRFCSQTCYHNKSRSQEHRERQSTSMKKAWEKRRKS